MSTESAALLCVLGSSWAVAMEPCAGTSKKPRSKNTTSAKYFEDFWSIAVLLHFEQHRYFGAMDGFDLAFDNRHTVFKSHIETVHGLPKKSIYSSSLCSQSVRCCHIARPWRIKMENGISGCLLKRLVGQRIALAMRATARFPEPQSIGVMCHKIDALFGMEARNVATTFDTRAEETYIDDTQRCHQVRAENAWKVRLNRLRQLQLTHHVANQKWYEKLTSKLLQNWSNFESKMGGTCS